MAMVDVRASRFASEKRLLETGMIKAADRYRFAMQSIASEGNRVHSRRLRTQAPSVSRTRASFQG